MRIHVSHAMIATNYGEAISKLPVWRPFSSDQVFMIIGKEEADQHVLKLRRGTLVPLPYPLPVKPPPPERIPSFLQQQQQQTEGIWLMYFRYVIRCFCC